MASPTELKRRAEWAHQDILSRTKDPSEIKALIDKLPAELRRFVAVPVSTVEPGRHQAKIADGIQAATRADDLHALTAGLNAGAATSGQSAHAATLGGGSPADTEGYGSHALTAGTQSRSDTRGKLAHALAAGVGSSATTQGPESHSATLGAYGTAESNGALSHAVAAGYRGDASALGKAGIAAALGAESHARAGEHGALILQHPDPESGRPRIKVGYVGENGIKPDTYYRLHPETHEFEEYSPFRPGDTNLVISTYDNSKGKLPPVTAGKPDLAYAQHQSAALEGAAKAAQAVGRTWIDDDGAIHHVRF